MSPRFALERLSAEAVPRALDKVHLYRVLNMPRMAESICHDVLAVEPDNERALVELILSLVDQYAVPGPRVSSVTATQVIHRLSTPYLRAYYSGLDLERRALALIATGSAPGYAVYEFLVRAMGFYRMAMDHREAGNDDALLRWNTCARLLNQNPDLAPEDSFAEITD
jgi:hypothetical protein